MARGPHRVAIIGGGVAGLSAAHELAERGFEVHLFERRRYFGGKAASITIDKENPHTFGPKGLPGEHGFRFFPGWYRHLPDTLKRIPYRDRTVADNLVAADTNLLVGYNRDPIRALLRLPTNWQEVKTLAGFPVELQRLGLTVDDLRFFLGRLWDFLTASEERRLEVYEKQTWAEFLDARNRSREYRDYLVEAATRNTVAARSDEASAYTIAKIALQTLFDTLTPQTLFDRVLNGPTNEVWIEPWADYLRGLGVRFYEDAELEAIEFHEGPELRAVRFQFMRDEARMAEERLRVVSEMQRSLASSSRATPSGASLNAATTTRIDKLLDAVVAAQLANGAGSLESQAREELTSYLNGMQGVTAFGALQDAARRAETVILKAGELSSHPFEADYFIFALPIEQMAYYVNRSETLKSYDPSLRNIIRLSDNVDWMAGIQFYFKDTVTITRGHIDLLDSEWSLTAIAQTQFWDDFSARERGQDEEARQVRSILSVDISAWDKRGRLFRKEAYNCSPTEIAAEVWRQLKDALNRDGKQSVLRDEMLLGYQPAAPGAGQSQSFHPPPQSFYLDDSIVDRFDRKKQAFYDKARSVRFSAEELARKQEESGTMPEIPHRSGKRRLFNAEPLLINRAGSLRLRPSPKTRIRNMFLAGDYVRTHTDLATMEGANEAARSAVNQLLLVTGSRERPCDIWPLSEPGELFRSLDRWLFKRGQQFKDDYRDIPPRIVAGTASTAAGLAARALGWLMERK